MPEFVTVPNVPLVKTGTYQLSTGETTFTLDDLHAAVAAVQDPAVRNPVLKFGHDKAQLTQQPSVGRVLNLYVDEDTETLYGDYVGVPKWLADIMPIAYPDRSIEGMRGFKSSSGHNHLFMIEAVSLLGEDAPGVSTLEDLYQLFYGDGPPAPVEEQVAASVAVIVKGGTSVPKRTSIAATVEVEDVRRMYYESLNGDQMWWWIRSVRLDPNELIVDDDNGSLYRVPFDISGEEVTFGDAIPVKIVYEDVAAAAATIGSPIAVFASRAESRPDAAPKPNQEEAPVAMTHDEFLAKLRESQGLPEDASAEDILARLESTDDPTDPKPEQDDEQDETETEEPPAAPGDDEQVVVDRETYGQLQLAASRGNQAWQRQQQEDRSRFLDEAVKAGKFPPSRKQHYASLMEKDDKGTRQFIDKLAAGAIPVEERGSSKTGTELAGEEAYPASWLPEVQARRARTAGQPVGVPGSVTFEEV